MTDERPIDAETDALIAELKAAGLVTIGSDAEGQETWTFDAARRPGGASGRDG